MKYFCYHLARPFIKIFMKVFYRIEVENENVLKNEAFLLAGNHTSVLDPLLIISSTKKHINFFAKKEIFKPIIKYLFKNAGVISVDRKSKNKEAMEEGKKRLLNNELVLIFPEGTTNKTRELLPFKYGAVSLASKTNSKILPFVIKGKYKLFRKSIKLIYLNPYSLKSDDLTKENEKLKKIIEKELNNE